MKKLQQQWHIQILLLLFLFLFFASGMAPPVIAEESSLTLVPVSEKLIRIRPASGQNRELLHIDFQAKKSSYRVNESIKFQVKGNRRFYLMLFNVDPQTGKGVAILPNRLQPENRIQYQGNTWYDVPNPGLNFYSDRQGVERMIIIASARYIDAGKLLRKAQSKNLGDFYTLETPFQALDLVLEESYSEKRIRIRESGSQLPAGIVVLELNLRIR